MPRLHDVVAGPAQLRHRIGRTPSEAISTTELLSATAHIGLRAKQAGATAARLPLTPPPALALMRDGSVLLLAQCDGQRVLLQSFAPGQGQAQGQSGQPIIEPLDTFTQAWRG